MAKEGPGDGAKQSLSSASRSSISTTNGPKKSLFSNPNRWKHFWTVQMRPAPARYDAQQGLLDSIPGSAETLAERGLSMAHFFMDPI